MKESYNNNLKARVSTVINDIRNACGLDSIIDYRLNRDESVKSTLNDNAIRLVGFDFVKHCGWEVVLTEIHEQY